MAITFDKATKTFFLDGKNLTYAFYINSTGYPEHLYFGKKIGHDPLFFTRMHGRGSRDAGRVEFDGLAGVLPLSLTSTECSTFGLGDYREPCVLVQNATGDRLSDLRYDGYEILDEKPKIPGMPSMRGGETLLLHLIDRVSGFGADLYYTVYADASVVARHIVYKNLSGDVAFLRRAYSFSLSMPEQDYDVISLFGGWGAERSPERIPMHHGVVSIDSKKASSSAILNPFLALVDRDATEEHGNAYGVNLVYSSSYVLKVEGTSSGETLLTGGVNDFDFSWKLEDGEEFATPEVVLAYSDEGLGGMSRAYHDAYREHLVNPRYAKAIRPLLINNWEGTYFNFNNEKLFAIVDAGAGTGIDTFVLDDGWFGKRDSDRSGLGDWFVNDKKLEGGLKPLIDHVKAAGMTFGLWFEPEMISEDSEIYRAHPEYAIKAPERKSCVGRHQMMMDITRQDVRDYIVKSVNDILHTNDIGYVKWDFNRNVTEFFSALLPKDRQAEFSHRYALGLYELFDRIVEANPDIFFEGCSGGGARFDPAILAYFPQIWTSDDTDAEERTKIQYGTSFVYPLSAMSCHVSECPNHQSGRTTPFATRADIAHLGATGYELDTTKFSDDDREAVKAQIADYREMQDLVLTGDLFRVKDPFSSNYFAEAVVSKDKTRAVLTCYRRLNHPNDETHRITMRGLDPAKKYFVRELGLILSGATLLSVGIAVEYGRGDFMTKTYHFEEK